ncbi:MAG: hypothetical protein PWR04_429 [Anaerophaga sp.]|nr:hypothetical protein [Anaerophaga sp.]
MTNTVFIIPRVPDTYRNPIRNKLWKLCLDSLFKQTFLNWTALVVGKNIDHQKNDNRFIVVSYEGTKEEKLQKATEYIIQNNIPGDYIIRLDDDDIINPTILEKVSKLNFDIYVDKHQWFWHYESGKISNRVWNWYPNTCIHKREHALTEWGDYANGDFKRYKEQALLIENDHSKLHPYYKNKRVIFADKKHPVYLRTITSVSITAQNSHNHENYLKRFGLWHKNNLKDFQFLNKYALNDKNSLPNYILKEILANKWLDFRSTQNYLKKI